MSSAYIYNFFTTINFTTPVACGNKVNVENNQNYPHFVTNIAYYFASRTRPTKFQFTHEIKLTVDNLVEWKKTW